MHIHVSIDNRLIEGIDPDCFDQYLTECVVIRKYQNSELSLGEIKELMGIGSIEETICWLSERGATTIKRLRPEIEDTLNKNIQKLIQNLIFD